MKSMASAVEWVQAPPPARYNIEFKAVESGFSAKGESHLKITGEISDGPFKGAVFFHNIGTDGGTKYGAMGKKHLRSLGVPVDSDLEIPDQLLAQKLLGLRVQAECGNEQREKPIMGPDGKKTSETIPQFEIDGKTGQKVAIMNLTILGYITQPGFKLDLGLGQAGVPQGQPTYVQPGQPQQPTYGGPPPQYAQQGQGQFMPQQPQYAQPGQPLPSGGVGGSPQFQQPNPGFVPVQAQPTWNGQPNGVPPGPQMGAPTGLPPGVTALPQR